MSIPGQARDERVAGLETENAMLYLKLAQLRGQLQSSRSDANAAEDASDRHAMFRTHVMTRTGELRREVQVGGAITLLASLLLNKVN